MGFFNKKRNDEITQRKIWYAIMQGWADPKKLKQPQYYWPIIGEDQIKAPKPLTKKQIEKAANAIRNVKKKTNGQSTIIG